MLTPKQIKEIREHLEKAQNPIFFFDNDPDGLCSFLLLQRFLGRGKGVPVKSFPSMTQDYFRRIQELNADYIFILDKPEVSKEFLDEVEKVNLPVVWIDHHFVENLYLPKWVNYYNPFLKKKIAAESTTAFCWQIVGRQRKKDLWLAVVGCIYDRFMPKFYKDFKKQYPELAVDTDDAFEVFYNSQIGRVVKMLGAGLKDRVTNVITMMKFLMKAETPYDVLEETNKNKQMHGRFNFIDRRQKKFIEKAKDIGNSDTLKGTSGKLLFFQYGGEMSISSDLANELSYLFPEKFIVVVYTTGTKANISVRGENAKKITLNALEGLEGSTGGGHDEAVGAMIRIGDVEEFKKRIEGMVQ